jgi:hypothetical protein
MVMMLKRKNFINGKVKIIHNLENNATVLQNKTV